MAVGEVSRKNAGESLSRERRRSGFSHEVCLKCCQTSHVCRWNKDSLYPVISHTSVASMLPLTRKKPLHDWLCQHECGNHKNSPESLRLLAAVGGLMKSRWEQVQRLLG